MILRKIFSSLLYLVLISMVSFLLSAAIPGDAAEMITNIGRADPAPMEMVEKVRAAYALDQPVLVQYVKWMQRLILDNNLGTSFRTANPVSREIRYCFPATLELAGWTFLVTMLVAVPLGIYAALTHSRVIGFLIQMIIVIGYALPVFLVGNVLLWIFAVKLPWLPAIGRGDWHNAVLPVLTLSVHMIGWSSQIVRSSVKEQMNKTYVLVAKAKGLSNWQIIRSYILRPALIPILTSFLMMFGRLISGSFIVEYIFAWNGIGRLLIDSVMARDIPMIQGIILYIAVIFILINFLIDLLYIRLDPQISEQLLGSAA
ncbi:MAG: ABC transporter permease [Anaerolineaceae bacterium]|nr:ABC transporter permease [Anaerolineaceae bacterium]